MSIWEGVEVLDQDGKKHNASEVFADKVVALYFSAGWCPPCRAFTPKLKVSLYLDLMLQLHVILTIFQRYYEALKKANKNFEVVFVSRDREADDLMEYFNDHHGKWYTLEFGNPLIQDWLSKYEIKTIPALKVIKNDGTVVVNDARTEIAERGADDPEELFDEWTAFL